MTQNRPVWVDYDGYEGSESGEWIAYLILGTLAGAVASFIHFLAADVSQISFEIIKDAFVTGTIAAVVTVIVLLVIVTTRRSPR